MAPVYKLKLSDFMGDAEPIKYLFAYGGINYENVKITKDTDWPKTVPFGKVPVLEVDKKVIYQSVPISRYLGKLVGLVPADDWEAAELDAVALSVYDLGTKVHEWYNELDQERKAYMEKELVDTWWPRYLSAFEKLVELKGNYFGGKKMTWADLYFVGVIESVEGMWGAKLLEKKYPLLFQIYKNIHEIPAIETYVSNRPNYTF